ncbi:MAG: hypothetical protein ACHQ7M_03485, partial [Chloroflexota bacterium]
MSRRNRLLGWLLGSAGTPSAPSTISSELTEPLAASPEGDEDLGRSALLGLAAANGGGVEEAPAEVGSAEDEPLQISRDMFRVNVGLPANMEIAEQKVVPVRITNISGTGVALLYDSPELLPSTGNWLDLALPNRPKAMELELQ